MRLGLLPGEFTPRSVLGVAMLGGLGLTIALFITELALVGEGNITAATIAVLMGSVIAGQLGSTILRSR